jgi:hypothetical protein
MVGRAGQIDTYQRLGHINQNLVRRPARAMQEVLAAQGQVSSKVILSSVANNENPGVYRVTKMSIVSVNPRGGCKWQSVSARLQGGSVQKRRLSISQPKPVK